MSPAIDVLSSLCAVGIAATLLLNLAIQPRHGSSDFSLAILSLTLLLWGAVGALELPNANALAASALTATTLAYFTFIKRTLQTKASLTSLLERILPLVLLANLLIVWVGHGVSGDGSASAMTGMGTLVFLLLVFYAAVALWTTLISRHAHAARLRGAGLLVVLACASPLLSLNWLFSGALLLVTAATGWIGWIVVRAQARRPLDQLREELRVANLDLRQAVSEVASLRAQNALLAQQIQTAGQVRSEFLDKLGHKLRTPLHSIAGYTELLQDGLYGILNAKQIDRLGKIQRNGDNLLDLISNMLDLNTLNARRMELTRTTFSMNDLIERVTEMLEARWIEKDVTLISDLDPYLPPVNGDEARICQIVTQMLDNALKFTLAGEVRLCARHIRVESGVSAQFPLPLTGWLGDGEWVIVEVSDTGIGIAPEDQAKIFDEFYQGVDPRTEAYFGTGLGLTIAKRLAELHEGTLWLKSIPEQGSVFYLALRPQPQQ